MCARMFKVAFTISLLFSIGCAMYGPESEDASDKTVMSSYLSDVSKYNGIDRKEAIILAQSELYFHELKDEYYVDRAFVRYENEDVFAISFPPVRMTLQDSFETEPIMFYVDKKNGKVEQM